MIQKTLLSDRAILLLSFASAVVTANAYYIHPIIGEVAREFAVSDALVGMVPALNQIALALGVFLLLPLGDQVSNRKLVAFSLGIQVFALAVMALTREFWVFVAASTTLGFFTITPYLLPAYTSKRVAPQRLGFVTAVLTTGVVAGVQASRLLSGLIGEYFDWRYTYWLAALLMLVSAIALPASMTEDPVPAQKQASGYTALMRSLARLIPQNTDVVVSAIIQACSFGIFLVLWLGIGLHLTSERMGHGTALVGYLTAFSAIGLLTTAPLGRWADRLGAQKARMILAFCQLFGVLLLAAASEDWLWLLPPLVVMSMSAPVIDVTGRMTGLSKPPEVRTRMLSLYIPLMFIGGGIGSWGGTVVYDAFGWWGTVGLSVFLSIVVTGLSVSEYRRHRQDAGDATERRAV